MITKIFSLKTLNGEKKITEKGMKLCRVNHLSRLKISCSKTSEWGSEWVKWAFEGCEGESAGPGQKNKIISMQ